MKHVVLVGGGHAHLAVLRAMARDDFGDARITVISPSSLQRYSGMLPGWMSGQYSEAQCSIDLRPLVDAAGAHLIEDRVSQIDAGRRCIHVESGSVLEYDLLSLNIGSDTKMSASQPQAKGILPVKPLDTFFSRWPLIMTDATGRVGYSLVVLGAGAAGVELAFAASHALAMRASGAQVHLVAARSGPLAGHGTAVQRRVRRQLQNCGIRLHCLAGEATDGAVLLEDGTHIVADCVIVATGARAPSWLETSGLALDDKGYVAVDALHRSVSHENVFAAGDVCARADGEIQRSGVHAVFAGPVLATNLRVALTGGAPRAYHPSPRSLYLLACGRRYAVASWGGWSAEGAWVWHWKDWIDRRFIARNTVARAGYP